MPTCRAPSFRNNGSGLLGIRPDACSRGNVTTCAWMTKPWSAWPPTGRMETRVDASASMPSVTLVIVYSLSCTCAHMPAHATSASQILWERRDSNLEHTGRQKMPQVIRHTKHTRHTTRHHYIDSGNTTYYVPHISPPPYPAGGGAVQIRKAPCPRLIGSCVDLASPTRGRMMAAFNCSLSAGRTLPLGRKSVL